MVIMLSNWKFRAKSKFFFRKCSLLTKSFKHTLLFFGFIKSITFFLFFYWLIPCSPIIKAQHKSLKINKNWQINLFLIFHARCLRRKKKSILRGLDKIQKICRWLRTKSFKKHKKKTWKTL